MLAIDVGVHHAAAERAGAIKGVGGDQVADVVGLHAFEQLADAVRFELEDALRIAALEQGVGFLSSSGSLVQISMIDGVGVLTRFELDGVLEDGERAQAEEVHLEHADFFDDRP